MNKDITTLLAIETYIRECARDIRGDKIFLDSDVVKLYKISIEELYRIVAKNKNRFPQDFMFYLTEEEKKNLSLTRKKVYAFTEAGILMLGGQLKSSRAIRTHIQMIELFVGSMSGKAFELLLSPLRKVKATNK